MPEYINNNNHTVYLPGPDGRTIQIKSREKRHLNEFFDKYCSRGYISRVDEVKPPSVIPSTKINQQVKRQVITKHQAKLPIQRVVNNAKPLVKSIVKDNNKLIGRTTGQNANQALANSLTKYSYTISNNVAVGILSYNRVNCLKRLVSSILENTDLRRTMIFISDDASTDPATVAYLDELIDKYSDKFVVLKNNQRLGIAGNTNRLLNCLQRFKYSLLLNDDVEILNFGWDTFYFDMMQRTGFKHYIYRQEGVYGAQLGDQVSIAGVAHYKNTAKPHGAVLALTYECIKSVGYFNMAFGLYGMEHVDWSTRVYEAKLQPDGYFDVEGSDKYFRIHREPTSLDNKSELLKQAREVYENRKPGYVGCPKECEVPKISYVIPCRNIDRGGAIRTVIDGIRSQMFPNIEIIIVEHDSANNIDVDKLQPVKYALVLEQSPFNKSKAFNLGVSMATSPYVVLHDADMIVAKNYTSTVYNKLQECEACHLGCTVIYTNRNATDEIIANGIIDTSTNCDRVVGYYEGGSLACHTKVYWRIGGFNEDFVGYGCEDTEFYNRLSKNSKWLENRTFDLVHLWHSRTDGWQECHNKNKILESKLYALPMSTRVNSQYTQLKPKYNQLITEAINGDR